MEMILIKGRSFLMGSPENEVGRYDDERQHQAEVSDFCLGKCPVTNAEYRRFKPDHDSGKGFSGDDQPVVNVDWNDATAYTEWLSRETGETYRLPTEAQWEYACRAGTSTPYAFGENIGPGQANFDGRESYSPGPPHLYRARTVPVKSFPPNPWGLFEMHGNVLEWCQDFYAAYSAEPQSDPCGPLTGECRVLRGGSWGSRPRNVRSARRGRSDAARRYDDAGFRLARPAKP